jgi:transposase
MNVDVTQLRRLGIDEIALRKGHKDYVVVFVDLESGKLIGMADARTHDAIKAVMDQWGEAVLQQIEEVSIDLSGNYRGYIEKHLPNARIVADRFHVMQGVSRELNQVRNQVIRSPDLTQDTEESQAKAKVLKASKYALLKPEERLTEKQTVILEQVKAISPRLATMHQQKENLRAIFQTAVDWKEGLLRMADWILEGIEYFPDSGATIANWIDEISNYFHHHTSSGRVEGINNKLKLIKRSGYGFRNFENFKLRCLICWHLDFRAA